MFLFSIPSTLFSDKEKCINLDIKIKDRNNLRNTEQINEHILDRTNHMINFHTYSDLIAMFQPMEHATDLKFISQRNSN